MILNDAMLSLLSILGASHRGAQNRSASHRGAHSTHSFHTFQQRLMLVSMAQNPHALRQSF